MKRIVSIQDISCIGKCSQTVALPIISSMGIELAVLPTSILSTHTQFQGWTLKKLTDELYKIVDHWKKEKFEFDLIYIGYTGAEEILEFVLYFISQFKTDKNIVVFDPAMADNGKLYAGINETIVGKIKEVAKNSDILRLNLTEASILLNSKYKENFTLEEGKKIAQELLEIGVKSSIVTGIEQDGKIGAIGYDGSQFYSNFETKYNVSYHGTGDVFTSALAGSIAKGEDLEKAISIATKFTTECVRITYEDKNSVDYGVNFEEAIGYLLGLLKK